MTWGINLGIPSWIYGQAMGAPHNILEPLGHIAPRVWFKKEWK